MIIFIVAVLGLMVGSFLNVCIYRIPKEESIAFPPSHCMNCGNRIKIYDLIPVISYVFLKGKCRNCGEKISIRYPLIELFTGALFLIIYLRFGISLELFKYAVLSSFLIVIGMIDFDTTDVYVVVTRAGMLAGVMFLILSFLYENNIFTYLYGALLGGGIIGLIILFTRGMGSGDLEICALSGLYLGFKLTVLMMFLSFVLGGIIGAILMLTKVKSKKDMIPFGPFIVISTFIAMLFGNNIIDIYLNHI